MSEVVDLIFVHIPDRDFKLPELSAHHLQLKCMGGHYFSVSSLIESTTILSDVHTYLYTYYYVKSLCGIGMRD